MTARRGQHELVLETAPATVENYEYTLRVPGEVSVLELGVRFVAEVVEVNLVPERDRQDLIDPDRLGMEVVIRNWRAGDRFWPGYTRKEKKIKELLNDRHITGKEKKLWPIALCRGELVWLRGFAVPEKWQPRSAKAVRIREIGQNI